MMDLQESLAADTLLRMSQAAQMASYFSYVSDRLSESAIAWAKEMHWLRSSGTAHAARYNSDLNHRMQSVDAALADVRAGRRDMQTRLAWMQNLAEMRRDSTIGFLDRLGIGPGGNLMRSATPNQIHVTKHKYLQLPIDQAMEQIAADVLGACTELQSRNARLEAALQSLPELHRA